MPRLVTVFYSIFNVDLSLSKGWLLPHVLIEHNMCVMCVHCTSLCADIVSRLRCDLSEDGIILIFVSMCTDGAMRVGLIHCGYHLFSCLLIGCMIGFVVSIRGCHYALSDSPRCFIELSIYPLYIETIHHTHSRVLRCRNICRKLF